MLDTMQIKALTKYDARCLVNLLLKEFAAELEGHVKIEWNNRFSRIMGRACLSKKIGVNLNIKFKYLWLIKFSTKLWKLATEDERREVIIHEVAHIVQYYRALLQGKKIESLIKGNGHLEDWQCVMKEMGYAQPKRFHNVGYSAYCPCRTHKLTPYRFKKVIQGVIRCKHCREYLNIRKE